MKRDISCKLFFTVLWRGISQVFRMIGKLFGYKDESTYAKVVWRIFASCVTILLALFTGCVLYAFTTEVVIRKRIRPRTASYTWDERHISNHIVFQTSWHFKKGRLYDKNLKKVLLEDVDWVVTSDDMDSLAVFSKNSKRGYINRITGVVAVPETYTRAWIFSEGLAAVEKDGELVFIDHSGNIVIDKDFQVHYNNPKYAFKKGYCLLKNPITGKMGLIDRNGEWRLPPEYDNIIHDEGFWQVKKDGCVGLYTSELNVMFPVENTGINIYNDIIEVRHADHTAKRYDHNGNIVVDFVIDDITNMLYETTELRNDLDVSGEEYVDKMVYGIANCQSYLVRSGNWCNNYYGLLNRNGKIVTQPIYTSIQAIGKDQYLCQPDGVIINDRGEIIK